jgi:nucleotide-binding universal stress UspA family protein
MRVLICHDGSPSATGAIALAASMPWPPDTRLDLVRVGGDAPGDGGQLPEDVQDAVALLSGPGRIVRATIATGRPATTLRDLAMQTSADLIVLGSRGHSPIRSLLLGSVSAELVERAPCSVLVARGSGHEQLLVGTDGSATATAMPHIVCAWELFRGTHALVVGVAEELPPGTTAADDHGLVLATRRLAARLATCGLVTRDRVVAGDPAGALLEVAQRERTDIIAIGPRGRSRVARLLLGSVARKIAQHAGCSVLVVRGGS